MVALHATDPAAVYLSAMARLAQPSVTAVAGALHDDRSLIRHHAMRRTIWAMTPTVARSAHAACTAALAIVEWRKFARMVEESDIAADGAAWVAAARAETLAALHSLGSSSARDLARHVPALTAKLLLAQGKSYAGTQSAHTRVLQNLGFDAAIVRTRPRAGWTSSEFTWAVMDDWLPGGIAGSDAAEARADLVSRYLRAFGPATVADVQWWTGWSATVTKQTLAAVGAVEVQLSSGATAVVAADDLDPMPDPGPWVAVLPGLDPTLMGWKGREWYLDGRGAFGGPLFDRNGNGGPTIWMDGRVVGGWAQAPDGSLRHRLLVDVPAARRRHIDDELERMRDLIGDARVTPRFPNPLLAQLLRPDSGDGTC